MTKQPTGSVLYRWKPTEAADGLTQYRRDNEAWADEYLIVERPELPSGLIVYGWYRNDGQWHPSPQLRPLVQHLLQLMMKML